MPPYGERNKGRRKVTPNRIRYILLFVYAGPTVHGTISTLTHSFIRFLFVISSTPCSSVVNFGMGRGDVPQTYQTGGAAGKREQFFPRCVVELCEHRMVEINKEEGKLPKRRYNQQFFRPCEKNRFRHIFFGTMKYQGLKYTPDVFISAGSDLVTDLMPSAASGS